MIDYQTVYTSELKLNDSSLPKKSQTLTHNKCSEQKSRPNPKFKKRNQNKNIARKKNSKKKTSPEQQHPASNQQRQSVYSQSRGLKRY